MANPELAKPTALVGSIPLGVDHGISVLQGDERVRLRVTRRDGMGDGLDVEIVLTAEGPCVRVRAVGLELDAVDSVAIRCKDFCVEATDNIEMRAGKNASIDAEAVHLEARVGRATIHANDDVQLLGEQVLLNCDRQPPMPAWIKPSPELPSVPLGATSGDPALLALAQEGSDRQSSQVDK